MKVFPLFALVALAIGCGINLAATARRVPPPPHAPSVVPRNIVLRHEQRLAHVREVLRARAVSSPIGYLADLPVLELAASHHGMEEYFLTQFAVAPWVLDTTGAGCDWWLANLHTAPLAERMPEGFRMAEQLGEGLWLLERIRS